VLTGKISSPWTPASSGPPADTNGSGSESKLDVGDLSDVRTHSFFYANDAHKFSRCAKSYWMF
jgi:hypothetical protein